jgi:hypothetical protein
MVGGLECEGLGGGELWTEDDVEVIVINDMRVTTTLLICVNRLSLDEAFDTYSSWFNELWQILLSKK